MIRLTKRVRDGLHGAAAIAETVLEHGGEGFGLECVDGPDHGPCNKKTCEICTDFANIRLACEYIRQLANKEPRI